MFTIEELQLIADALAAHYGRWQDEEMRKLLDKIIVERERQRVRDKDVLTRHADFLDISGVPGPFAKVLHEGPNYNRPEDRSGAQRIPPHLLKRHQPIQLHDITPEVMNRILRSISNKEMG